MRLRVQGMRGLVDHADRAGAARGSFAIGVFNRAGLKFGHKL